MRFFLLVLSIVVTASAQFPNSGFENWTGVNPDSCWVNNSVVAPVIKTGVSYKGSSALRGEVVSYVGVPYGPQLTIGSIQGFAYTGRPASVQFYYQFAPQGGDKFEVSITLRKNNPLKIIAAGPAIKITSAASAYTLLTVPLEYFYTETPDICVATFLITNSSAEHIGSYYHLDEISFVGNAANVNNTNLQTPAVFALDQNYPNPFNPTTTIRYSIPFAPSGLNPPLQGGSDASASRGIHVSLKIYDLLGREIATLVNEEQSAGWKEVQWNAMNVSSGMYFYTLQGGNFIETKKMLVVK